LKDQRSIVLRRLLNDYSPIDESSAGLILEAGTVESYRKNEVIFHERRFNAFEYFQLEGVSHRYNMDEDNHMLTTGIYKDEVVITPHFARTTNGQSIFSMQALADCTFLKVPAGIFSELREQNVQLRNFGRAVVEREFVRNMNFEVLFRSQTAKDRLLYFRKTYTLLENLIPHTVIASYLGITPVSFSRLRNELAKKGDS
jgi:CRP-like cAMP-binding protein